MSREFHFRQACKQQIIMSEADVQRAKEPVGPAVYGVCGLPITIMAATLQTIPD